MPFTILGIYIGGYEASYISLGMGIGIVLSLIVHYLNSLEHGS